jgi:DNA-binding NtrC family response regulator
LSSPQTRVVGKTSQLCGIPAGANLPWSSGENIEESIMQHTNVVLLQSDPNIAQTLAALLSNSFHLVHVVRSVDDLRHAAAKHRPAAIVLDLESVDLSDIEALKKDFDGVRVICNHRVADEEMWTRSLSVGADDCCPSSDMRAILSSATRADQVCRQMAA